MHSNGSVEAEDWLERNGRRAPQQDAIIDYDIVHELHNRAALDLLAGVDATGAELSVQEFNPGLGEGGPELFVRYSGTRAIVRYLPVQCRVCSSFPFLGDGSCPQAAYHIISNALGVSACMHAV